MLLLLIVCFEDMSYSWAGRVDFVGWWKCCKEQSDGSKCNREVNSEIWGTTCPDCTHVKCDYCEVINPPAEPTAAQIIDTYYEKSEYTYSADAHTMVDHTGTHQHAAFIPYANPTFNGWWTCCQCPREVNSAWCGWTCPDCSHPYSSYCCTLL